MNFRAWLQQKWYEHREELELYKEPLHYDLRGYFAKYKYWLKREYQHQLKQTQDR